MARLEDVARKAGVSKSTASRALARPELVAESTRERVRLAAAELDYHHNRAARALTTGRTGLLGLVVPTLANPFYAPLVLGAQQAAEELDRHLLIAVSEHSAERERRLVARLAEQVDGLVMMVPLSPDAVLRRQAERRPLILVDRRCRGVPAVLIDTPGGVAALADHLLSLGHRRIAYVAGPSGAWADKRRRRAVADRVGAGGGELVLLGPLPPTFEAGIAVAAQLPATITAVIAYNSFLTLGLLHALTASGRRVPEDLSLASADDLTPLGSTTPTITALDLPVADAGRAAVMGLHELLIGRRPSRRVTVLPARVLTRDSTGPVRRACPAIEDD